MKNLNVTDQQARQILAVLISEGEISEAQARQALDRYGKRVAELRDQLARLEAGLAPSAGAPRARVNRRSARQKPSPAKRRISPQRRKAMRQQGKYLAAVRPLKAADRAKIKAVRAQKGFAAAIAEARRLAKGGARSSRKQGTRGRASRGRKARRAAGTRRQAKPEPQQAAAAGGEA